MKLKSWINKQFRKKSRVYIFPTRMGGYLNGLIFLMYLLAIGYSNNLLLIFTTFLLAFNLLWLVQSHFHLHRLKLENIQINPGHAGNEISVKIFWKKTPKAPWNWEIRLESDKGRFVYHASNDSSSKSEGSITLPGRGPYHWQHLKVKTSNPFGLYNSWIYFQLNQTSLVYPALLKNVELTLVGQVLEGELWQDKKGHDDFRSLANYSGEEARKISWKHYARSGDLFIKEGEDKNSPRLDLDLRIPKDHSLKEDYLSRLATQLVECQRRDIPFRLKGPGIQSSFLPDCLKVLAIC